MSPDTFMRANAALRHDAQGAATGKADAARDRRRNFRRNADAESDVLAEVCRWLVNRTPQPQLIVDNRLNVLLVNAASQQLLADAGTVGVSAGRLVFGGKRPQAELNRVIDKNLDRASFTVRIDSSPETVTVLRLPSRVSATRPLMLTITCSTQPQCDSLQTVFGLTRAESQIALAIFRGLPLVSVAQERQASINTVKTQLRYVFQKLGVNSQAGVTRRVAEVV